MNIPEISVDDFHSKLKSRNEFIILDIREIWEIELVSIKDKRIVALPMSQIAQDGINAFSEKIKNHDSDIVIVCHHGIRSARVTEWLIMQGWKNVYSLRGGVDAYASEIDSSIGFY